MYYYLSLIAFLSIGFTLPVFFQGQKELQLACIVFTAFLYVVWGVSHHIIHHSFSIKIMLEYIAIAVLVISVLFFAFHLAI